MLSKPTPYYTYNIPLLKQTIEELNFYAHFFGYIIHYAVKANANTPILKLISSKGLGADCVSGNEISKALRTGFQPKDIVFAGVGKTDEEIVYALKIILLVSIANQYKN